MRVRCALDDCKICGERVCVAAPVEAARVVTTDVPARLDRLPWSRFHWLVLVALGITWILDGLEVTIAGSLTGALQESPALQFTPTEIGLSASAYLAGNVIGAALFGWLTDKFGRKRLFNITLGLYLLATAATALAWDFWSFAVFRFLTGAGIGGEYTAINSAIQEMIPARMRGWTDLAINGSFWMGAALGAGGSVVSARSDAVRSRRRLAAGVRHRRFSRPRHPVFAQVGAGEPALADDARASRARRSGS